MNDSKSSQWLKLQYVISILLFACVLFLGVFHAKKGGINLTDEGLYFSAPYRYSFGAVPFKDAIHNATRQYDLLMAPIFQVFPNITVLQYRTTGVLLHLSSIVAVFFLFSKLAPPILVAAFCAIFFFVNTFAGIPTPSYNSLVTAFGLWTFVLWMLGLFGKTFRKKCVFIILSAIFMCLTIASNISALVILIVPFVSTVFFWLKGRRQEAQLTVIFIVVVSFIFLFASILLFTSGIWPYFLEAIINDATSSNLVQGGIIGKISRTWEGIMSVALNSLYLVYLITNIGIFLLWIVGKLKGKLGFLIMILSIFGMLIFFFPVSKYPAFDFVLVIFSILCFPIVLINFFIYENRERIILILGTFWSLVQIISFGMLSTNALQSTVKGAFLLFLVAILSIYKLLSIFVKKNRFKKVYVFCLMSLIIIIFTIRGINTYLNTIYLEVDYNKLTTAFKHPKLAGIYSVPEKIKPLEDLLEYLKPKLMKGDYLIAYNDLPILYYLTDTQPLYPNVWSFEYWWPLEYRKKLMQKMLTNGKNAQYAVHMVTNPGYGWGTPITEGLSFDLKEIGECLLCNYVENNYVLEKYIFPFEVWRKGKGEKLEFLKKLNSYYAENFSNFLEKDQELVHGNLVQITPFWLDAVHGRYTMKTRIENGKNVVKFIFNGASSVYSSYLDLGYYSERVGFNYSPTSEEEVAFTATIRLSSQRKVHPYYSALLYIQDRLTTVDNKTYVTPQENSQGYSPLIEKDDLWRKTNSIAVPWSKWHQYAVVKKIRDKADHISFGITWVPLNPGDWIEVNDMHFYTADKSKAEKFIEESRMQKNPIRIK